ncbi:PI-PLC X domain-containing protein 3-like [Mya arenaria]|uniref:PI-PLC X domain-containing protein 3-like n=1 Tax=Mya arenaria TaxID=6604 RepID=UPI0022E088E5|nr:PI-PLC X domain-containing protein 3-like [Mya arenaria]
MSYVRWMSQLPAWLTHMPLSCLAIPGSHNSGTSDLDPALGIAVDQTASIRVLGSTCCGSSVVRQWSKTQHLSILEQLKAGVRYFDFRVALHPRTGDFRFVHGLYGSLVEQTLWDIKLFLLQNPQEVAILHFYRFYNVGIEAHKQLLAYIRTILGELLVPRPFSGHSHTMWGTTLNTLWQTTHRVIAVYNDDGGADFPDIWHGEYVDSPWPNTNKANDLINFLENNYTNKHRYKNDTFYNWQGVLTARTKDVALSLSSSLEERLASSATASFVKWLRGGKVPGPQELNICTADFVENHDFIPTVIALNQHMRDIPRPFIAQN